MDSAKAFVRSWGPPVLVAFVIALGIQWFVARPFEIPSPSMSPTIEVGDRVMVNRLSYTVGDIERGQVIVFDTPPGAVSDEDFFVKRVIGLPGETVQLNDGNVYVGQQRMIEPYVVEGIRTLQRSAPIPGCSDVDPVAWKCTVPDGYVFVMGDNRGASVDSRTFGPVAIDTIVGRAAVRVWPLTEFARL